MSNGCPICRGTLRARIRRRDGKRFWGCADFPRCRGTRTMTRAEVEELDVLDAIADGESLTRYDGPGDDLGAAYFMLFNGYYPPGY